MRRRDFLKGVAAALGVNYLPPCSKTENVNGLRILNDFINANIRRGDWEILVHAWGEVPLVMS